MAHVDQKSSRRKRKKYNTVNVAREARLRGSDSNDLMKVYNNAGIGELLLLRVHG